MHIGTPEITSSNGVVTWATPVDAAWAAPDRLWFSLPEEHAGLLTDLADPALLALLIPAMHEGDALIVEAPVSDELAHNLRHSYQQAMCQVIGGLSKVRLEIRDPAQARDPKHGVGTGFSAGVDSFAVVVEHRFSPVPPDLQLSHLTFFNVGSHGRGEDGRRLFRSRFDRLTPVAGRIGLPFVPVDSNLDDFYRLDFRQTHGPRTMLLLRCCKAAWGATTSLDRSPSSIWVSARVVRLPMLTRSCCPCSPPSSSALCHMGMPLHGLRRLLRSRRLP